MKRRIVLWATIGLLVGCVWIAYAFANTPDAASYALLASALELVREKSQRPLPRKSASGEWRVNADKLFEVFRLNLVLKTDY